MSRTRTTAELAALIAGQQLDAAIEAGLMEWQPLQADDAAQVQAVQRVHAQLQSAWAARERFRNRAVRLRRREAERQARRAPPAASSDTPPPLPASVAAILARAKARAAQGGAK